MPPRSKKTTKKAPKAKKRTGTAGEKPGTASTATADLASDNLNVTSATLHSRGGEGSMQGDELGDDKSAVAESPEPTTPLAKVTESGFELDEEDRWSVEKVGLMCHLCGQNFVPHRLEIHLNRCLLRRRAVQGRLPAMMRKDTIPEPPKMSPGLKVGDPPEDLVREYNNAAMKVFETESAKCLTCNVSQPLIYMEKHMDTCKAPRKEGAKRPMQMQTANGDTMILQSAGGEGDDEDWDADLEGGITAASVEGGEDAVKLLKNAATGLVKELRVCMDILDFAGGGTDLIKGIVDGNGESALHLTASGGFEEATRLVLSRIGSVEAPNKAGDYPINLAAIKGNVGCVRALANHKAVITQQGAKGNTALHNAAECGHTEVVECLLTEHFVDPNPTNDNGWTPLHISSFKGDTHIVWTLVYSDARIYTQDEMGDTPLHFAAWKGHADILHMLLSKGTFIDCQNKAGNTPLHNAAANNHLDAVIVLKMHGANHQLENAKGETPTNKVTEDEVKEIIDRDPEGMVAPMVSWLSGHYLQQENVLSQYLCDLAFTKWPKFREKVQLMSNLQTVSK